MWENRSRNFVFFVFLPISCLPVAFSFLLFFSRADAAPKDGGATVRVEVADGGDTFVSVLSGQLKVQAGGLETRLSGGQGAEVKRGQGARKISLLAAPKTLAPTDGQRLNSTDVSLVWAPVQGARGFHLLVATDLKFAHVVHDDVRAQGPIENVQLAAGAYFWKVSAVDGNGLEGRATAVRRFVIDLTPPKLKAGAPQWK